MDRRKRILSSDDFEKATTSIIKTIAVSKKSKVNSMRISIFSSSLNNDYEKMKVKLNRFLNIR